MIKPLMFGSLGWPEILLIALVILLVFGAKRIPELMRSMGKGVKNFKEGINGIEDAIEKEPEKTEEKDKA